MWSAQREVRRDCGSIEDAEGKVGERRMILARYSIFGSTIAPPWLLTDGKTALGRVEGEFYSDAVSGFLRFVGIVNAAIWFGASVFFALVVLPGVFSSDVHKLFGEETNFKYYAGGVAMTLFGRFFALQYVCGFVALAHLAAEKLYLGRGFPRVATSIATAVLLLSLIGGVEMQPRMKELRQTMYSTAATPEQKAAATHSFNMWHGMSEAVDMAVLVGLLVFLMRVAKSEESNRYGTLFPTFRG
jgi:Domain of unknown function (DUF4149)